MYCGGDGKFREVKTPAGAACVLEHGAIESYVDPEYCDPAYPLLHKGKTPDPKEAVCHESPVIREKANNTYKAFNVGEYNVILPHGRSFLSSVWARGTGNRIVEVIDTNRNGRPDSGDTGIDFFGNRVANIQFAGALN